MGASIRTVMRSARESARNATILATAVAITALIGLCLSSISFANILEYVEEASKPCASNVPVPPTYVSSLLLGMGLLIVAMALAVKAAFHARDALDAIRTIEILINEPESKR